MHYCEENNNILNDFVNAPNAKTRFIWKRRVLVSLFSIFMLSLIFIFILFEFKRNYFNGINLIILPLMIVFLWFILSALVSSLVVDSIEIIGMSDHRYLVVFKLSFYRYNISNIYVIFFIFIFLIYPTFFGWRLNNRVLMKDVIPLTGGM